MKFQKPRNKNAPRSDRRDDGPRGPFKGKPQNDRPQQKAPIDYRGQKQAQAAVLEDWIWGEHSVEVCAEVNPENLLEVFVENAVSKKIAPLMEKLSGLKVSHVEKLPRFLSEKRTQGIAAKIKRFPVHHENDFFEKVLKDNEKYQVLVLDRVQDPQNFGAIVRSAAALGATSIFIGRREQCPVNGTVALVSAGNLFRVKIFTANNLAKCCERLKDSGFWIGALAGGGKDLSVFLKEAKPEKIAWILGAEEDGIQASVAKIAHEKIGIPMLEGVESLNVSNSAAIALYAGYSSQNS